MQQNRVFRYFRPTKLDIYFYLTLVARKFSIVYSMTRTRMITSQTMCAMPLPLYIAFMIKGYILQRTHLNAPPALCTYIALCPKSFIVN